MEVTGNGANKEENSDLRLLDFAKLIKDTWLPAMVGFLLFGAVGVSASYLVQPEYNSRVLLEYTGDPTKRERIGSSAGSLGGLAAIAGFSLGSDGNPKDATLAILRSWDFAGEFIRANGLAPLLNEDDWNETVGRWRNPANPPSEWRTIKAFHRDVLHISDDAKTGLVSVSVEWKDPVIAADWATKLVLMINARLRKTTIEETNRSIRHLKAELVEAQNTELQRAIAGLLQAQIEALMFADIRSEFAFRTIDPALAPPIDEYFYPNHILFFILGGFAGSLASVIFNILIRRRKRQAFQPVETSQVSSQ